MLPFRSTGSFGKLFKSLSNLISSLLVSEEYLSSLAFLISLKSFVWDFISPKINIFLIEVNTTKKIKIQIPISWGPQSISCLFFCIFDKTETGYSGMSSFFKIFFFAFPNKSEIKSTTIICHN